MSDLDLSRVFEFFEQGEYQKVIDCISPALVSLAGEQEVEARFVLGLSLYQTLDFPAAKVVFEWLEENAPCLEVFIWQLENLMCLGGADIVLEKGLFVFEHEPSPKIAAIVLRAARYLGRWSIGADLIGRVTAQDVEDLAFISEAWLFQVDVPDGNINLAKDNLLDLYLSDSSQPDLGFALAYTYLRLGDSSQAKNILDNMKCFGVFEAQKNIYMAWVELLDGNLSSAQKIILSVLNSARYLPLAHMVCAYVYYKQGSFIRAAHSFSILLNKNEGFYREIRVVADFLCRCLHNYPMAFKAYTKLIAISAATVEDFFAMAWCAFHNEQKDYIKTILKELRASLGSNHPDILSIEALLDCADGYFDKLLAVPKGGGKSVFFYYAQCILATVKRNFEVAEKRARQGLDLFPDDLLLIKALVDVYIKQERWLDVQKLGEPVLKICPTDFELRSQMMLAAIELNDKAALSEHDILMFRHSINEYEAWLWDKLSDANYESPYVAFTYIELSIHAHRNFCNHDFSDRAEEVCRRYIENGPEKSRPIFVKLLLRLLMGLERFDEGALLLDDEAFSKNNDFELLKATYYSSVNDYDKALHYADLAFKKSQGHREYDMLAAIYIHIGGNRQRIFDLCDRAVELNPNNKLLKWNTSFYASILGDAPRYDRYLDVALDIGLRAPCRRFMAPLWQGESLAGKTILIWREQGIGDELSAAMYFQALIDRAEAEGGTVKIECTERLLSLFRRSFPKAQVDTEALDDDMCRTDLDFHIPALSVRKNTGYPFTSPVEYVAHLHARQDLAAMWKDRLAALGDGLKVGICWRSGLQNAGRNNFYALEEDLEPLLKLPNVHWVNLNYSGYQEDHTLLLTQYGVHMHIWDDLDLKNDFEGLAALTSELDLVISAASTPGVLACCLGKPTWNFTFGADHKQAVPTYEFTTHYPALMWQRHYTESYRDVFEQMASRLARLGHAGLTG